jgi:SOS-response transcriptional repressor LexA
MPADNSEELKAMRSALRMTLKEIAAQLDVPEARYANWEYGRAQTPIDYLEKIRMMVKTSELSGPKSIAYDYRIPVPYVGQVAASTPIDWANPLDATEDALVPAVMANGKGRFCARVVGLSMMPVLMPDDLLVFQASNVPKLGVIVLYRSPDNQMAVKELKDDGKEFTLHSYNETYAPVKATGSVMGHLIGIVREHGARLTTVYDPSGIRGE